MTNIEKSCNMAQRALGHWEYCGYCAGLPIAYCTACHEYALYNDDASIAYSKYCPHCGAKMDIGGMYFGD